MALADTDRLSISLLTREYPPTIYGGAGVHVAQLVPQLRKLIDVDVQCMGEPREGATAHAENYPEGANAALRVFGADLSMVAAIPQVDLVHSHTSGTPTWPATLLVCSTTFRTLFQHTRWNRTVPGRPSSLAAVTGSRPGPRRRPSRQRMQ